MVCTSSKLTAAKASVDAVVRVGHNARISDKIKLTLIENGKPNAKKLLSMIGEGVKLKFPEIDIFIFSKPSAAKPIDADEAQMLAVRSHMVISGLGD